ncbi:uncharacterized protein C2845_PM04G28010 [Panicum miliaceum]|uniref:EF-hand domain-containing protein n=1 Tax=Panicum miliaceum TaxID=4540 RepID=A0A3L6QML1_PANMI|nr:uncharacterized protein C2845_PM04G28010 [Panicum miliaceum]
MAMATVPPPPRCLFPGKEHRNAITVPEFKNWLKQFDTDGDGRISRKELREAIRRRGAWFSGLRALFAIRRADRNRNGFVDDSEIEGLMQFAERELGFRITTDAAPAGGPPLGRVVMGSPAAAPPLYRSTTYVAY